MSVWKILLTAIVASTMLACLPEEESDPPPRLDVTLEPSQIAVNFYTPPPHPLYTQEINPTSTPVPPTGTPTEESTTVLVISPTETATPPPSNSAELRAMQDNDTLLVGVEMDDTCILAGKAIPFTLTVQNLDAETIYFYRKGNWLLSINNSLPGPQLASVTPTTAEDFSELAADATYTQEENDLGLWVLSLGAGSGIPFTPTGTGLPAGNYWTTFIYSNDQDGGSNLIPDSVWMGTAVSPEIRFTIVNDQSEC